MEIPGKSPGKSAALSYLSFPRVHPSHCLPVCLSGKLAAPSGLRGFGAHRFPRRRGALAGSLQLGPSPPHLPVNQALLSVREAPIVMARHFLSAVRKFQFVVGTKDYENAGANAAAGQES